MAKTNKSRRKPNTARQKTATAPKGQYMPLPEDHRYFGIDIRYIQAFLVLLGVLLYANTIPNEYALDDGIVVTKNEFTQRGLQGIPDILSYDTMAGEHGKDVNFVAGGRYRPLSVVTLAIEYELFDQNPHISHFVNGLLYGLTGLIIFSLLVHLLRHTKFEPYRRQWFLSIPFLTALLYLLHPIHTEAVANIKGRDEIMTFMGALGAFWFTLRYIETKEVKHVVLSGVMFFLGLLSKENAITFLAVIPVGLHFFTQARRKEIITSLVPLLVATAIFLVLRRVILGTNLTGTAHELMNNPFVYATTAERFATVSLTLGKYLLLLLFPHPLTWDYYPYHIPLVNWEDWRAIVPLLVYLAIGIYGLVKLPKKQQLIPFAIVIFMATLSIVSNIFIVVGAFMSERFLYLPSLGYVLALAWVIGQWLPGKLQNKLPQRAVQNSIVALLVVLSVAGTAKTLDRNRDWKDNFALFTHDVQVSQGSAKGHTTAGEQLLLAAIAEENDSISQAYFKRCMDHFHKAIQIHPKYIAPRLDLGIAYNRYKNDYDKAAEYFLSTLRLNPSYDKAYQNIELMFDRPELQDSIDFKIEVYEKMNKINPKHYEVNYRLGSMYGAYKNNLNKAVFYLKRAVKINPRGMEALTDLGVAYGMSGQYEKAINVLERAVALDTKDPIVYSNLSATYKLMGDQEKANYYNQQYKQRMQEIEQERARRQKMQQQRTGEE